MFEFSICLKTLARSPVLRYPTARASGSLLGLSVFVLVAGNRAG